MDIGIVWRALFNFISTLFRNCRLAFFCCLHSARLLLMLLYELKSVFYHSVYSTLMFSTVPIRRSRCWNGFIWTVNISSAISELRFFLNWKEDFCYWSRSPLVDSNTQHKRSTVVLNVKCSPCCYTCLSCVICMSCCFFYMSFSMWVSCPCPPRELMVGYWIGFAQYKFSGSFFFFNGVFIDLLAVTFSLEEWIFATADICSFQIPSPIKCDATHQTSSVAAPVVNLWIFFFFFLGPIWFGCSQRKREKAQSPLKWHLSQTQIWTQLDVCNR